MRLAKVEEHVEVIVYAIHPMGHSFPEENE